LLLFGLRTQSPNAFFGVDLETESSRSVFISKDTSDIVTASVFVDSVGFGNNFGQVNRLDVISSVGLFISSSEGPKSVGVEVDIDVSREGRVFEEETLGSDGDVERVFDDLGVGVISSLAGLEALLEEGFGVFIFFAEGVQVFLEEYHFFGVLLEVFFSLC